MLEGNQSINADLKTIVFMTVLPLENFYWTSQNRIIAIQKKINIERYYKS
jgi:hypothetical protein